MAATAEQSNQPAARPGRPSPTITARTVLQVLLLAVPVVIFAYQAWHYRWMFDDGFINLRVVRQLEAGHGPVFNTGQRVEAFTSALWVFVLLAVDLVTPLRLEWVAVFTGITLSLAGLTFAIAGATSLSRRSEPGAFVVPFGVLVPIALTPMWYFASSGLEGGLTFAWIGLTFLLGVRWARGDGPFPRHAALILGLGWLIRPELVLLTGTVLVVVLLGDRSIGWRSLVRTAAWAAAIPLAYQVFRMGYYGVLLPNTAIAKSASSSRWGQGWRYLSGFGRDFHLLVAGALLLIGYVPAMIALRSRTRAFRLVVAFVAGGLLNGLYIVRVGGDYIPGRLLLPAVFILMTPVAAVALTRRQLVAALILPVWATFAIVADRPAGPDLQTGFGVSHPVTVEQMLDTFLGANIKHERTPGIYFGGKRIDARPGPYATHYTVSEAGIGAPGYGLPLRARVLDWLGLVDPMTAHFELTHRGLPGHEKPIPGVWAAAELTAPGTTLDPVEFQAASLVMPLIPRTTGPAFDRQVGVVRSVLRCRAVRDFTASYTAPLTFGRFVSNFFDSPSNTTFTIPPDPVKARRAVCPRP